MLVMWSYLTFVFYISVDGQSVAQNMRGFIVLTSFNINVCIWSFHYCMYICLIHGLWFI